MNAETYTSYRNLPPLAGLCSLVDASRVGLDIEGCVTRLKRQHWTFRRLHEILVARIPSEPVFELKSAFGLHAHYCAEHAQAWRNRVAEMREPPLGLDTIPDQALDIFFDEIRSAPDTAALLLGVYEIALPALATSLRRYHRETNPLVDAPSVRIGRFALLEVDDMVNYGRQAVMALAGGADRTLRQAWLCNLQALLQQAGSLDGADAALAGEPQRHSSAGKWKFDGRVNRDERFSDTYNLGVHAEAFLYDPEMPAEAKPLMLYYKRMREIDVPEMMAGIIVETPGKPWEYYRDLTRQLWDEVRHSLMGEVGFVRAGINWAKYVRINKTWSHELNRQLDSLARHSVLYFIEQGLMPKTGKRFEWETALASGDAYSAMIQDFDWADEVLHARIGRDWYVRELGDARKALDLGDRSWARVLIDWRSYRERGLTKHENWWPALYREYCRLHGKTPDPKVAAYATSYESVRPDLRSIPME